MMKSNDKVSITKGDSNRNNKQIEITFHVDCDVMEETVSVTPYSNVNSTGNTPRCTASSYTKEQKHFSKNQTYKPKTSYTSDIYTHALCVTTFTFL